MTGRYKIEAARYRNSVFFRKRLIFLLSRQPADFHGPSTKYPVVIRKKGTAILPRQYVRRKSRSPLMTENGAVWMAMTRTAAKMRKKSIPAYSLGFA